LGTSLYATQPGLAFADDTLYANGMLAKAGEYSQSRPNGNYVARISSDGSFVIYRSDGSIPFKTTAGGNFAVMQSDGNFVLYQDMGKRQLIHYGIPLQGMVRQTR
jgi:hypothetical protein